MISYRLATPTDAPFIQNMLYQALYAPSGSPPFPYEIIFEPDLIIYFEDWGRKSDLGLIASDESGQPIGAAWLRYINGDPPGYGHIADDIPELSIALLPEYRNQGIGRALISQLLDLASTRCPAVSLSVIKTSPAKRLYERVGFKLFEPRGEAVVMIYSFSTAPPIRYQTPDR